MSIPGKEAERIYYTIFNKNIPASIRTHFNVLSKRIESCFSAEEIKKYFECIEKVRDLEALELAARHLKKIPVLTEKFKIMVYLAETLPENYAVFINEQPKFFLACILLISSIFRTGYRVAKGMVILMVNRI
jgi:hypothetical protein